jgi:hypothetical protein
MVCALAIKAATTKRAVFALCELGDGDNAMALTRVLLENACLLEWLIRGQGRRRLESYAMFTSVQHEQVAATLQRYSERFAAAGATTDVTSDPYHRAIWSVTFRRAASRWRTSAQGRVVTAPLSSSATRRCTSVAQAASATQPGCRSSILG